MCRTIFTGFMVISLLVSHSNCQPAEYGLPEVDMNTDIPREGESGAEELSSKRSILEDYREKVEFMAQKKTEKIAQHSTSQPNDMNNTESKISELDAPFGDLPKVIKDKCKDYPSLTVNSAASKPYVGLYIISDKHYLWMQRPKSPLTHPLWEQTVEPLPEPIRYEKLVPWDAFFISGLVFYIRKNDKFHKFTTIPRNPDDVKEASMDSIFAFKQLPKGSKVNAAFEAMAEVEDEESSYFAVIYTLSGKQEMLMTKGNSTTTVPVTYTWSEEPITALGMFDYRATEHTRNQRLGFVAFGKHFKYFEFVVSHTNAELKIVSPMMDNQVLFGCPQTFCFHSAVDAITMRGSKIIIFRGLYYWEMANPSTYISNNNLYTLKTLRTQDDRTPFLTTTIDAAFYLPNTVYIIRQGRIYIEEKPGDVLRWKPYDTMFTNMQDADWFGGMDAAFRSPLSPNNTYIIKGTKYWHLLREDSGDFTSLGSYHISNLRGFPAYVEAAFYYEPQGKVYAFSGNYLFIHDKSDFAEGVTDKDCEVKLIQETFFSCGNKYPYDKTDYKSLAEFKSQITNFQPPAAQKEANYLWLYSTFGVILIILVIVSIITIYFLLRPRPPAAIGPDTGSQESLEAIPITPKASGFSIGEELQDVINEKRAKRGEPPLKTRSEGVKSRTDGSKTSTTSAKSSKIGRKK